jgi:hypothetical protein
MNEIVAKLDLVPAAAPAAAGAAGAAAGAPDTTVEAAETALKDAIREHSAAKTDLANAVKRHNDELAAKQQPQPQQQPQQPQQPKKLTVADATAALEQKHVDEDAARARLNELRRLAGVAIGNHRRRRPQDQHLGDVADALTPSQLRAATNATLGLLLSTTRA